MSLGTKNRQIQTADLCKQFLRDTYKTQLLLVEEFIRDFEGSGKSHDITRWGQFADLKDQKEEMIARLEEHFEQWLNPPM